MARKQYTKTCPSCISEFRTEDKRAIHCSHSCANRKRPRPSIQSRFWAMVKKGSESECWPWLGTTDPCGYGRFRFGHILDGAHRVAWILTHGEIPHGEGHHGTCVCHRCDNRPCCNPAHLFLASNAENVSDKVSKGRLITKLTPARVLAIRESNMKQCDLAREHDVSEATISMVKRRAVWAHLP